MAKHGIFAEFEVAGEKLVVVAASIRDRLDEVPLAVVTLVNDGELPKPKALLGADAKLAIGSVDQPGSPHKFQGIVTRAERRLDQDGRPTLKLEVRPKLWRLTLRNDVRTFQNKSATDILKEVVEGAGAGPVRMDAGGSYSPMEFVVQYRETDLEFLLRLGSEEGIGLAFDHETGKVVFFDDPRGLDDAADKTIKYIPEFGFDAEFTSVGKVTETHRVASDKVLLRDYDPTRPRFTLEKAVEGKDDGDHALEVYQYPARTNDDDTLEHRAQVLLDSMQARRDVVTGSTTSWTLAPGQRFTIEGHPYAPLDVELLTTGIELEYDESSSVFAGATEGRRRHSVSLKFTAIPTARSAYRPPRRGPRPTIAGIETAVTTGASGQEIDVDDAGRVTVIYPWDRVAAKDDTSSVRMRTLQLGTGGSMLLPRVGWEVVVQHDEGDPDLPLVMGRLYNAEKPPPYALPAGKARSSIQTATTPGGGSTNELRTDDSAGSEEMFFNASKDMTVMAKNNATEGIGNNATLKVGGNQDINVTNSLDLYVGADQSVSVGGNQKSSVETFHVDDIGGSHTLDVGGNRDMKVGGDHKFTIAADETLDVGSMKTDLVVGSIDEKTDANMTLDVSAVRATLTAGSHNTTIGGNLDEKAGAAKVSLVFGAFGSEVGGNQDLKSIGAAIQLVTADRSESAAGMYTEIAAGAHIVKADNIVFEAETALTVVMGGTILSLTPASVALLGASSVKFDGDMAETSVLTIDNV
ncbi:MAG: type VI secretion system tip protein VgrG [Myxococcales bacterium]|nr:type VI secretion system tip protein VgrG [Myxococcales bacterium]